MIQRRPMSPFWFSVVLPMLFATVVILGVGVVLPSPASAQAQKKLSVAVVVNTSDYKWISLLLKEYEKKTGVKIEEFQFQTGDYVPKYAMAFEAKRPRFDVVMLWDLFLPQMVAGNYMLPLDGSANPMIRMADEDRADFFPQSLRGVTIDGHLYAVPESLDTGMFYYRKDLYAQAGLTRPPRTWDELVQYSQKLTKGNQWGYSFIGQPSYIGAVTFFELLNQAGGTFLDDKGLPAFNSSAGVKALQFMADLRNKYKVVPPGVNTYGNVQVHTGVLNGTFAQVRHWPYLFGMAESPGQWGVTSAVKGQVGIARLPYLVKDVSSFNNWTYAIPRTAEDPEGGWELIKFLTNRESCLFEILYGLDIPARKSAYLDPDVPRKMPAYKEFFDLMYEIMQTAVPYTVPEAAAVFDALGREMDRALVGSASAKEALDAAAVEVQKILKR